MRITGPVLKVIGELRRDAAAERYGLDLMRSTGLQSGTMYRILDRLEEGGLVTSQWEDVDPTEEGRPRRRMYRLTGPGVHEVDQILFEHGLGTGAWT